jgi:protocatechuate 3,4-dioxygenase beta subunit
MKRRDLLKGIGAAGAGVLFPVHNVLSKIKTIRKRERMRAADCWVTPSKTEGPYYFDANLYRQDIRTDSASGELHDGLQLNMTFTVINANCEPLPNVLVDIWHCDKDGFYSGYNQPAGDKTGQNFMRALSSAWI